MQNLRIVALSNRVKRNSFLYFSSPTQEIAELTHMIGVWPIVGLYRLVVGLIYPTGSLIEG